MKIRRFLVNWFAFRNATSFSFVFASILLGIAFVSAIHAMAIPIGIPLPAQGIWIRFGHHFFDALEALSVGIVFAFGIALIFSIPPRIVSWLLATAFGVVCVMRTLNDDLHRQALVFMNGRFEKPVWYVLILATGFAFPFASSLGFAFLQFRILRWVIFILGTAAAIANHFFLRDDYEAVHGAVSIVTALIVGPCLAWACARRALTALERHRTPWLVMLAISTLGIAISPPNLVRFELFRERGSVAPWILATWIWNPPESAIRSPVDSSASFGKISNADPISEENAPIVVLVTIDATRADAVESQLGKLPTLNALATQGVMFSYATSPGSQTAVSLSTMFSGKYFSELQWDYHGIGTARFLYPASDSTLRFPEILSKHGVKTVVFCGVNFLSNDFGVARGFAETKMIAKGRRHAMGKDVIDPLIERIRQIGPEPTFLYVHLMEPHFPYDRGDKTGSEWDKYLSEIRVADGHIARIAKILKQTFPMRGTLIVTSDHGEAFGEHQTKEHTKTLYQELLRVPLLFRGPGIVAHHVDQHVSLIDLGPTILELFGVNPPESMQGRSLVRLLHGENVNMERPVFAEGRLRRAMFLEDVDGELKIIEDLRRKTVEAYDLTHDPGELMNVFDENNTRHQTALSVMRQYFLKNAAVSDSELKLKP